MSIASSGIPQSTVCCVKRNNEFFGAHRHLKDYATSELHFKVLFIFVII